MRIFSIGDTNFAVDATKSRIRLDALDNGMVEIDIDIHGDDEVFMRLTEPEDGEWSWALHPPAFFLHGLKIPQGAAVTGPLERHADAGDSGIYMMEYGDISAVDIMELSARRLAVSGMVDLSGKRLPFLISY